MATNPNCHKCKKQVIAADAGIFKSIPYLYCRNCKIEVDKYGYPILGRKIEALEELDDYLSGELGRFPEEELIEVDLDGYPYSPFGIK